VERHPSLDDRADPAIRIVDHRPEWRKQAADELARVAAALGAQAIRLEHVGSTAVPGLAAKPIVDLLVAVQDIRASDHYATPLQQLGYLFVPDPDSPDFHFFAKPPERPRSFHLHVCQAGSHDERRHLAVRDFLRADPQEAERYERVKRALAARHPGDRLAYIAGKESYVSDLEARALEFAERA
jgi:GrpB-like predicted nucleotidyltransferase (UPF0157 family)